MLFRSIFHELSSLRRLDVAFALLICSALHCSVLVAAGGECDWFSARKTAVFHDSSKMLHPDVFRPPFGFLAQCGAECCRSGQTDEGSVPHIVAVMDKINYKNV